MSAPDGAGPPGGRASVVHEIGPRAVGFLAWIAAVLVALSLLAQVTAVVVAADVPGLASVVGLLDADEEQSLFTWYSSALLAVAAVLALTTSRSRPAERIGWHVAALALVALSIDEVAGAHERLGFLMQRIFDASLFTWVIPGAALAAVGLWIAAPFIRRLDPQLRRRLIVGTAVYLIGALGIEGASGFLYETRSPDHLAYRLTASIEEAAEIAGILIVISGLMHDLARRDATVAIHVGGR